MWFFSILWYYSVFYSADRDFRDCLSSFRLCLKCTDLLPFCTSRTIRVLLVLRSALHSLDLAGDRSRCLLNFDVILLNLLVLTFLLLIIKYFVKICFCFVFSKLEGFCEVWGPVWIILTYYATLRLSFGLRILMKKTFFIFLRTSNLRAPSRSWRVFLFPPLVQCQHFASKFSYCLQDWRCVKCTKLFSLCNKLQRVHSCRPLLWLTTIERQIQYVQVWIVANGWKRKQPGRFLI